MKPLNSSSESARRATRVLLLIRVAAFCLLWLPEDTRAQDPLLIPRYVDIGLEQRRSGNLDSAVKVLRLATSADSTYGRAWFELGYALHDLGRNAEAVAAFESGLRHEPGNIFSLRQIGYWYGVLDRPRESIAAFESARALGSAEPRDELEIGFAKRKIGDRLGALSAFATASAAKDPAISESAREATGTLNAHLAPNAATSAAPIPPPAAIGQSGGWIRPLFMDMYAAPLYQTRFNNAIAQVVVRGGAVVEDHTRLSPYISLRMTRDARSHGGEQPVIFSDNIAVPAIGIRQQPLRSISSLESLYFYIEDGAAIELVNSGQPQLVKNDLRAGGFYIGQWRVGSPSANDRTPMVAISDVYLDASYYSRFENTVGSAQLRESLRVYEQAGRGLDLYAKLWTVADSRRVYYNNAVEAALGISIYPDSKRQVVVMLERMKGRYMMTPDPTVARNYDDARITVILSAYRWVAERTH
ncbi:MAG: hypothetical protein JWM95_762 [Gemmatimonadetes bacterium]|nr:hypothetical protein [Gemmatimonadota bacterium]